MKTAEMIVTKIFMFVGIATLSHRHEETDGFLEGFTMGPRSFTGLEKGMSGKWSE